MTITRAALAQRLRVTIRTVIRMEDAGLIRSEQRSPFVTYAADGVCRMLNQRAQHMKSVFELPDDLMTSAEVAKFLKVSTDTVVCWSGDGQRAFPHYAWNRKLHRYNRAEVYGWWMQNRSKRSRRRIRL